MNDNLFDHIGNTVLTILLIGVAILVLLLIRKVIITFFSGLEMIYALFTKRPVIIHFYPIKRKLDKNYIKILNKEFAFYKRLNTKHKRFFEHRVATFIKKKSFQGRQGFIITDEVKVLVAATAVMLTFGFRNYLIPHIKKIIIYPTEYFSRFSKTTNKGEFNARLKTIVLSWDNFLEGYRIEDDRLNLGIHEFAHAIHYNCIKNDDVNSIIFVDTFEELRNMLTNNDKLKEELLASEVIRSYASTNDSELLAVIIETFIESPEALRTLFPPIYDKVKQMLNFYFHGY